MGSRERIDFQLVQLFFCSDDGSDDLQVLYTVELRPEFAQYLPVNE